MSRNRFYLFIILGLTITLSACLPALEITITQIPLQLGETRVDLVLHESSAAGLTYLNLHDNENTSVRAALDIIKQHGGRVYELKHSGARNISFTLDGIDYEFDPNRMFSDDGATASLERFGPVNVHNNGRGGYSILSYAPEGEYSKDALHININDKLDPDDFYFVTETDIYNDLLKTEQNVVLQDNNHVTEDGSLSIWSAQEQLPYVNVEVQDGHRQTQMDMILLLHDFYFLNQNR